MKNKINLRKLIFILIGMFFCVIPIEAKAADYEASFKFYKYDSKYGLNYEDFGSATWLDDYKSSDSSVRPEEITDLSELKPGDILVVSPILKTINPTATAISIYFRYNKDVFTYYPGWETTDMRSTKDSSDAIFPYVNPLKGKWSLDSFTIAAEVDNDTLQVLSENGEVTLVVRDNSTMANRVPYNYVGDRGFAFLFLKVKDGADLSNASFTFATETNPIIDNTGTSATGKFVTMASTTDNMPVDIDTTDYIPEIPASTVKTLKDLVISNGSNKYTDLSWASGSTETSFNSVIPASISNVDLKITPFHSAASIACTKNCTGSATDGATMTANLTGLTTGTNNIEVTVHAEDGSTQVYLIDIKKLNNDTSLGSVTLTNGITLNYDSGTKTYSATGVPYATNKTSISASVTSGSNAVIDSTGTTWAVTTSGAISNVEWNLNNTGATANTGTIKVNAEDCDTNYNDVPGNTPCTTTTYNVSVSRNAPKTIATLKSLIVNDTPITGFVPDDATKLSYDIGTTTDTTIKIAGVVTDNSGATIESGTGNSIPLSLGTQILNVVVKAEDGTTKNTYKITVKRLSIDATLSGLSITSTPANKGVMDPATFASGTKAYTYTYDETVTSVSISATANHNESMVQIGSDTATKGSATGTVTPTDGGIIDVNITSEGNTTDSYRITFRRKKSTVNTLSALSVKDGNNKEYITSFNAATNTYNITVENDITSLSVNATATSSSAKINNGTNTYNGTMNNLNFTSNSLTLTVSPEDTGATAGTYTINVTRKKSANANLTDLQVDGTSLSSFDGTQNGTYNLSDEDSTKASVNISYTKENDEATVAITNNGNAVTGNTVNLVEGNNVIVVAVTSQDKSTTISHTINIKKKSSVATLSGLTLTSTPANKGVMNPTSFNSGTKTYTYTYEEDITSLSINATSTHNEAMVQIGSETASKHTSTASIDPKTMSSVIITVTAEDGHSTDTYTINFTRKKSSVNTLKEIHVKNGSNEYFTFDVSTNSGPYNVSIPHDIDSVDVSAIATSDAARINSGNNTYSDTITGIDFNTKTVTLTVTPEEGTAKTYTINITRTKSDNAYLTDLKVDGNTVNGFNKLDDTTPFDIGDVSYATTSLNITYDKENTYSIDTIQNNTLTVGDNTVTVKVVSQDGTKTMNYKIKVHRMSNDTGLASLDVTSTPQGTLSTPVGNVYTYTYDRTVTSVNINAVANSGEPVIGNGNHTIASGDATLTVAAEDPSIPQATYTIKFVQELETDSSLSGLSVAKKDGTTLNIGTFSPTGLNYSLTVDSDVDKIDVAATVNGSFVKKITIGGTDTNTPTGTTTTEVSLNPGSNPVTIAVTAEDNTTTTYTINVTRTVNTNATLSNLEVGIDSDTPAQVSGFNASTTVYNLPAVDSTKSSITIIATPVSGAKIDGSEGPKTITENLDPGDNTFSVTVDSGDGNDHATYTINVRRKLADAKITNLTSSSGTTLKPGATEFAYTLDVPSGTTSVSLTPTFMTGASLKTPSTLNNIDISSASTTEIRFTVQAEDTNITNEYVVTLNKLQSTNNFLGSLSVDKGTLTPGFDKTKTEYTVTVGHNDDKINVNATVEDAGKANIISGTGETTLNYGSQDIIVRVEAEDGSTKDYKITVTRPRNNDTSLSDLTIDGTTITGFNATKDTYNISLPFGTTSFVLGATPTDGNIVDSATKLGTMNITGNSGTYTFEVEAQDGTKKTYTINVTVSDNNDTSIGSLTVLGKTPTWNPTNNRYELTVDGETLKVIPDDVTATFTNGASITNKDPEMNLVLGANSYKFEVTAVDGTTKEYEVLITREASTINTLDTLTSSTGTFEPVFDKDTNIYKLIVPDGTTNFTISATATSKNPATTIIGTGDYTMPIATNPISVSVRSEDGTVNIYEITVEYATAPGLDKIVAKANGSYKTDDDYVLGVRNKTNFDDVFKGQFDNEPTELVLYLKDGTTKVTTDPIGTGMILKLERDGKVLDQKEIVVLGDTSGDGEITVYDAVIVVNHFLKTELLNGAYLKAADTSKDDSITVYDAVIITNHFLKTLNIYE